MRCGSKWSTLKYLNSIYDNTNLNCTFYPGVHEMSWDDGIQMLEHKYKVMISGSAFRLYEEGANHSPEPQHLD